MPRVSSYPLIFICLLLFIGAAAQNLNPNIKNKVEVKGFIRDTRTKQGITGTIFVLNRKLSVIDQVFAGKDGSFQFDGNKNTSYTLKIYNPDYEEAISSFDLGTANFFYIDTIFIKSKKIALDTIIITAKKKIFDSYADRTIYHVQNDPDANYSYTFDIIKKIPGIFVGPDEELTINGSQNILVLMNGRKSAIMNGKISDVMQAIPASNIQDIIITSTVPSKYASEGINAIIDIVTKKRNISGWNGSIGLLYGDPQQTNDNIYFSLKSGIFGFTTSNGIGFHKNPFSNSQFILNSIDFNKEINTENASFSNNKNYFSNNELSIEVDSLDLLSINLGLNYYNNNNFSSGKSSTFFKSGEIESAFDNNNNGQNFNNNMSWGADYERASKKTEGQTFTISYFEMRKIDSSFYNIALIPLKNYTQAINQTNNEGLFKERTFQLDFVKPFHKNIFEIGVKNINRYNESNYYFKSKDSSNEEFSIDPKFTDVFNYTQSIYSGYSSLYFRGKNITFKIGSSIEKSFVSADFKSTSTSLSTNFFNILPSSSLSLKIRSINFRIGYAQTIERPGLYYLNPYINQSNPYFITYGNPNLRPAKSDNFDFGFNFYKRKISLSFAINFRMTNNAIVSLTSLGQDQISRTTYENIGRRSNANANVGVNFSLFKAINFSLNWSPSYNNYSSYFNGELISRNGFMQSYYGNISLKISQRFRINGNGGFSSNSINIQGISSSFINTALNMYADLGKKKKTTFNISIINPHSEKRIFFNENSSINFFQFNQTTSIIRQYRVGINTRFGGFKGKVVKRKKRGIQNTDLLNE